MPHLRDTLIFVENLLLEKNTLCVSLVPLMGLEALVRSDLVVLPFWYLSILNRFCLFVLLREEHCGCVCVSMGRLVLAALAVCSRSVGRLVVACTSSRGHQPEQLRHRHRPPQTSLHQPIQVNTAIVILLQHVLVLIIIAHDMILFFTFSAFIKLKSNLPTF